MRRTVCFPPRLEAIDDEIAGFVRSAEEDGQQPAQNVQNALGNQLRFRIHVMVRSFLRLLISGFTVSRKRTDLCLGLGVDRYSQRFRILIGSAIGRMDVVEYFVDLLRLFQRLGLLNPFPIEPQSVQHTAQRIGRRQLFLGISFVLDEGFF